MDTEIRIKLLEIRGQIDSLLYQEKLQCIGTFYGEYGKYNLYLFPKATEMHLTWREAKEYCKGLGGGLPTIGELQYIKENNLNYLTFENDLYWSSTEYNASKAHNFNFLNGNIAVAGKDIYRYVRAIKKCNI